MRKKLIVIDMQNDFIDGSLGTPEAEAIVPKVLEKIHSYPAEEIIFTRDTHEENYLETREGKYLPVEHCIRGTDGWQIRSELQIAGQGAAVFDKPTFGSVELASYITMINEMEPIEVEMVGLCTDICVVSNALLLKAANPEMDITVDSSCCAGVTPEKHEAALETMRSCQINVI